MSWVIQDLAKISQEVKILSPSANISSAGRTDIKFLLLGKPNFGAETKIKNKEKQT